MTIKYIIEIEHHHGRRLPGWLMMLSRSRSWVGGFGSFDSGDEAYRSLNAMLAEARDGQSPGTGWVTGNWRIVRRAVQTPIDSGWAPRITRNVMLQGKGEV